MRVVNRIKFNNTKAQSCLGLNSFIFHRITQFNNIILTCHRDFALISTDFVCWGSNFTLSTAMHMQFFPHFIDEPPK